MYGELPQCTDRIAQSAFLKTLLSGENKNRLLRCQESDFASDSLNTITDMVLELEQVLGQKCSADFKKSILFLKRLYLKRLSVPIQKFDAEQSDRLFRAFVAQEADLPALIKRIQELDSTKKSSVDGLLTSIYGFHQGLRGIEILGGNKKAVGEMESLLAELCQNVCPFFSKNALYKILVVPDDGLAAYFPKTATLILSQTLFDSKNTLHKVVLTHELTHVWEQSKKLDGSIWLDEYPEFSGWRKKEGRLLVSPPPTEKPGLKDELTALSSKSRFSLLPDAIFVGSNGFDGFVTKRSYENSLKRQDISEDLADHIAIYRFLPRRFCDGNRSIAPKKLEWIAKYVFPHLPPIKCGP